MSRQGIKILLAKAGLDGHDRGILTVAMACRESGMEVIYGGLHLTPQEIVSQVIQEGVDLIGISSLSDAHMTQLPLIIDELRKQNSFRWLISRGIYLGFCSSRIFPYDMCLVYSRVWHRNLAFGKVWHRTKAFTQGN